MLQLLQMFGSYRGGAGDLPGILQHTVQQLHGILQSRIDMMLNLTCYIIKKLNKLSNNQ